MRVISGEARGRRLRAPKGRGVRPTASKVKGAIFNILVSRFDLVDVEVLDLFAGAGALGIEALSRGARRATFVEGGATAARVLRDNLRQCGFAERSAVVQATVPVALRRLAADGRRFDGVLLDPPYRQGWVTRALRALADGELVRPSGWVIVEHADDEEVAPAYGRLRLTQTRRYGKTALSILQVNGEDAAASP